MKKTLLAAALAVGFAGVAQAETSVTLYGVVDTGVGYTRFKHDDGPKATRTGLYDGVQAGNRWGLRGSEDLGNGLRAIFQLESGFTLSDGESAQGGKLFGREASLGLQSDAWGTLKFGRQTNFASQWLGGIASPFGDAYAEAHIGNTFTSMSTVRADNVISYATPNFSGFQFGVGYSFNASGSQGWEFDGVGFDPDDRNAKLITTALVYANGPLAVGLSYDRLKADEWDESVKAWNLAGSYDFEVVKLHLGFGQERDGTFSRRGVNFGTYDFGSGNVALDLRWPLNIGNDYKANNYSVGLSAPVGAGKLMVGWQSSRLGSGDFKDAAEKNSQNLYSIGYNYPLSKRTAVYAVGTYGTGYAFTDTKVSQAIVGLNHRF